jgi:hypothetical protein
MSTTSLIAKLVGPVLLVRAVSLLIDPEHFVTMINGLDREVATVSLSFFLIALMMAALAILALHSDHSTPAGLMITLMAWGAVGKASALMLFPHALAAKALLLQRAGFLNVILIACVAVGSYFTWFGYFRTARPSSPARP